MRTQRAMFGVLIAGALVAACGESKSLGAATTTSVGPVLPGTVVPTSELPTTTTETTVVFSFDPTTTVAATVPPTTVIVTVPPTVAPTLPPTTVPVVVTTPPTVAPTVPPTTVPIIATPLPAITNLQPDAATLTLAAAVTDCSADPGFAGYVTEQCVALPSYSNGLVAMIQRATADSRRRVILFFKKATSPDYESRYLAVEPATGTWTSVRAEVGDYNGDDGVEAWIGYRYTGTGGYLDLDVLDPRSDGTFFLGGLRQLPKGSINVRPSGADVSSAVYVGADPTCCPSSLLIQTITRSGLQWRIDAGAAYPAASAPGVSSDFP